MFSGYSSVSFVCQVCGKDFNVLIVYKNQSKEINWGGSVFQWMNKCVCRSENKSTKLNFRVVIFFSYFEVWGSNISLVPVLQFLK